jgi:CheY-like chemotaxis protein
VRSRERELGRPRTPIIAITASVFEHDRPSILAAGCDGIVTKPCREAVLFDTLVEHLGVRFVHERPEGDDAGAAESAPGAASPLSPERLSALPAAFLDALRSVLAEGDDLGAQAIIADIAQRDPPLGAELRARLKRFQLDELLSLVERARP